MNNPITKTPNSNRWEKLEGPVRIVGYRKQEVVPLPRLPDRYIKLVSANDEVPASQAEVAGSQGSQF